MCQKRLKQNKLNKMHPGGLEPPIFQLTAKCIIKSRHGDDVRLNNFIFIKFKFTVHYKMTRQQDGMRIRESVEIILSTSSYIFLQKECTLKQKS